MNHLSNSHTGRCVLHILVMFADHEWKWHLRGVWREIV